ncbi:hypothetical protein [Mixta calida]|uniref:hypothetical protein n=1 Tax=Mixta calida TaxID=665913 RepID=UPI00291059D8|nr:hypothetical protein [Mixta calida]MDU4291145.1 hypothetical protein [Mixta calida]
MFDINNRKLLYCLPYVFTKKEIVLENIIIKPLSSIVNSDYCKVLLNDFPFNINCSIIETSNFKSGDLFNIVYDYEIKELLEVLKFSYFFERPSALMEINGFVGNESFELCPILEKKTQLKNLGFEHKVSFSNGMFDSLFSLDNYFSFRAAFLENFTVTITNEKFSYYSMYYRIYKKQKFFDVFKMYNKCWGIYSIYSFSDKALYSKISIELLSKNYHNNGNKVLKMLISFFEKLKIIINNYNYVNRDLYTIYKNDIEPRLKQIESVIADYFNELNDERKRIAHEGRCSSEFINVAPYLIILPIIVLVLECDSDINEKDIYRLIFLLGLFLYETNSWQSIKYDPNDPLPGKRTNLSSYINFCRCYPKYVKNRSEAAKFMLEGFQNWLAVSKK